MIKNILFWAFVAAGLILSDFMFGPLFPDEVYCLAQAGTEIHVPQTTKASSWSANDGCTAYNPRCATEYTTTPARNGCLHKTIWDAWSVKLGLGDPRKS
ncbi:hypothetical protein ABIB99_004724 [Bradyrhizobium sp. LA6.1]